ncbi:MAG: ROK family transcriptional regulator [Alkalispirochaetaceae bacterium]
MMRQPLRSNDIRESNEKLVLNLIFHHGTLSQSQVVQETGLKAPTVFRIFAKLEEGGFIKQCAEVATAAGIHAPRGSGGSSGSVAVNGAGQNGESSGERKGRRPNFYCVEPESGYALGVDFSSLAAAVIVVDFGNRVIYRESTDLAAGQDRDQILGTLGGMLERAVSESGIDREALLGIGIAAPGVVDTASGRVLDYPRIGGLSGYSLREHFEAAFDVPVYVHNNASVIASSAYHYGPAKDEKSLLAILVRSGVGGALVNHGDIFLIGNSTALEIGRTTVSPGSTEEVARDAGALETRLAEGPMLERLQETYDVSSWEEVEERLTSLEVSSALENERLSLGATLRNLDHIFHPEAILLITRFAILSQVLGDAAKSVLPQRRIIPSVYDPVQACYGATDMVFREFFTLNQPAR